MEVALRILVLAAGVACVFATVGSAVRTVVLPRGVPVRLTSLVFTTMRSLLELRVGKGADFKKRDRVMAVYAPVALLTLLFSWLVLVLGGYTAIYWALDPRSLGHAFLLSGSSLLTLGNVAGVTFLHTAITFTEAALGLLLLALLITYLPSLYAAFSRRELVVAMLEVRAGSPPEASEMLARFHRIHGLDRLHEMWGRWEAWFVELEETHTSFPALAYFRSPQPEHSWVTAAGAILDAASFRASTIEGKDADADLCIRSGYIALRRISAFFGIPFNPDPHVGDPISIDKTDFDQMYDRLDELGLPLRKDREQAWLDFWGWRVNYDEVLLGLARLTMAPPAPWSTDKLGSRLTARAGRKAAAEEPSKEAKR